MPDNFRKSPWDEEQRKFDRLSHAVTVISSDHRQVHDGMVFHANNRFTNLANGATRDILFSVPADSFPHVRAALYSIEAGPVDILAYEDTTTSADGTAVTLFNRNRNSSKTPDVTITAGPTVTDVGTLIHDRYVPSAGGQGQNHVGVITPSFGEEWILKPNTKYLLRLINNSGAAIDGTIEIIWYELSYDQ